MKSYRSDIWLKCKKPHVSVQMQVSSHILSACALKAYLRDI